MKSILTINHYHYCLPKGANAGKIIEWLSGATLVERKYHSRDGGTTFEPSTGVMAENNISLQVIADSAVSGITKTKAKKETKP